MSRTAVLAASAARTTSGDSGSSFIAVDGDTVALLVDVTAASGTTPSLTVSVQWSHDGATWSAADPVDGMTAITAVNRAVKSFTVKGLYARAEWTIAGTTPSFTFSVSAYAGG